MPSKLVITPPAGQPPFELNLSREETRIGRAPVRNELVLDDERVSREHAVIRGHNGNYVLCDLESANGTFVNGDRVKEKNLADRDLISIGGHVLLFEKGEVLPSIEYGSGGIGNTVLLRKPEHITLSSFDSEAKAPSRDTGPRSLREDVDLLRRKAETLSRLYELSKVLSSVFSLEDIFKKVCEMIFRTTQADRVVVLLKDPATGELAPFATEVHGQQSAAGEKIVISRTVLDRVVSEKVSLLSLDAQEDKRLEGAMSIVMQQVQSVMCAPLLGKDKVLGAVYADCQQKRKLFSADDLDMLNALASQTSMAVDNAITHEQLVKEALARAKYGRFMPQLVVDQILANPEELSLGGKNQPATMLFSDIRGFTTLAENLPPDTVVRLLNEYFGDMTPIVFENRGLLDKYMGDGMMAIFGIPYKDDAAEAAAAAVDAAVEMQRRMVTVSAELKEGGLPEIAIGIGIHTGTVTVGYIGSEQRTDYTAIGDAVNLAARLEKEAAPWQVLISHSTLEEVGERFPVNLVGEIKVKGRNEPVKVYEVVWRQASATAFDRTGYDARPGRETPTNPDRVGIDGDV